MYCFKVIVIGFFLNKLLVLFVYYLFIFIILPTMFVLNVRQTSLS